MSRDLEISPPFGRRNDPLPSIQLASCGLGIVLLDRLTKALALRFLADVPTVPILPGVFHLTLVVNSGVAFGLFRGYGLAVTVITLILLSALVLTSSGGQGFGRSRPARWGLGLILGGAVGNLFDRIRYGGVVDFLDFRIWPVFNLADSGITVGAVLVAWALLRQSSIINHQS